MKSIEALENWYNTESPRTKAYEYEQHYRLIKKDLEMLEQYKNIEEEFGINLTTLYKALTNGVWVKNELRQIHHTNVYLHNLILSSSSAKNKFCFITPDNVLLLFDRIKQDWALDKKELEK